jgi:hypothetical protein
LTNQGEIIVVFLEREIHKHHFCKGVVAIGQVVSGEKLCKKNKRLFF